ncbi:MAG TPA: alpha/beta fold hydrolase [Blastocatellia bacterium]|nr:alpha/beta fold hydrolase [Blastocatellia bacterium]
MKTSATAASKPRRRWWWLLAVYGVLLLASHLVRWQHHSAEAGASAQHTTVQAVDGDRLINRPVKIAYQTFQSAENKPTLVLLHGSPGQSGDFARLAPALAPDFYLIAPDLPGFANSTRDVLEYSIRAHARYVLQLLDELHIQRAHVVGFSMGGGVALNLADIAPERVASITMLSAIGVQEMELLGDYYMNHAVHGAQLAGLWGLYELTPHFGYFDGGMLSIEYARNFYDSDQRPLRGILQRYQGAMQIVQGRKDFLVPTEAAREHHRLVPQSELHLLDSDHFMVFRKDSPVAPLLKDFVARVERGAAKKRADAEPTRIAQAALPLNPKDLPKAMGVAALVLLLLIIVATFVTEDLTTISVGVMVAQGRIEFLFGTVACFLGIFIGDILLYLAGRYLGRPAVARAPLKWFVSEKAVAKSSAWFARQGVKVIFASRFVPGARLPTYFAAGLLHTKFWWFTFYFALACAVWTPLLVGLSAWLGDEVIKRVYFGQQHFLLIALLVGIVLLLLIKLLLRLAMWRGRRLLLSRWRRLTRWEFWPMWAFYPPVVGYLAYLAFKHRSLTLFTACNPAIPASGFVGESKTQILNLMNSTANGSEQSAEHATRTEGPLATARGTVPGFIPRYQLIPASLTIGERIAQAQQFLQAQQLNYPIILKPDAGERGKDVRVIRSDEELVQYFRDFAHDTILQEYVPGDEFGVFYYRYPNEARGHIFSITEKKFPVVLGDGKSTLEQLILNDERAVCMAQFYCDKQGERLYDVIPAGERIQLVEIGAHSKGTIFLDGTRYKTDALEAAMDRIAQSFDGFYFGRFDLRVPSLDALQQGRDLKIIELNGVTSEATSIYDPKNSVFDAYRVLCAQWRIAFEIGRQNRARGINLTSPRELTATVLAAWQKR